MERLQWSDWITVSMTNCPANYHGTGMSIENPLVSVSLPVYNGEDYIREAIRSVLNQTFQDFELLLLDNASTDGTPQICLEAVARDPRVRYFGSEVNRGLAWNHNRAVAVARGRYLMWMGHDDLISEQCVERCIEALQRDPAAVLCYAFTNRIAASGKLQEGLSCRTPAPRTVRASVSRM